MTKDRAFRRPLDDQQTVVMIRERSSTHPVEYAYMLIVFYESEWHTVRTFDNAHSPDEHHEHVYVRDEKQAPVITKGPINDAMTAAERKLVLEWADIVSEWEKTWHQ